MEKETYYRKRPGTSDYGCDYENMSVIRIVLDLITDKNVKDFELSLDSKDFGDFDDIVLNVELEDTTENYAIQLKQTTRTKKISQDKLMDGKYFKSFLENEKCRSSNLILLTNNKFVREELNDINLSVSCVRNNRICEDQTTISVRAKKEKPNFSIKIGEDTNDCYQFEIISDGLTETEQAYQEFFKIFFLYPNQSAFGQLEKKTRCKFEKMFSCSGIELNNFIIFIQGWHRSTNKTKKLNKIWMQNLIALHLLKPVIEPLSFGSVDKNMRILREAISGFSVTRIENESYEKVKQLWGDLDKGLDLLECNKLRTKYSLSHEVIEDISDVFLITKILWLMNKCPLIVTENETVHKVIEMCSHKLFVLVNRNNAQLNAFQRLPDLGESSNIYNEVLENFSCSLQGREKKTLKFFIERDIRFKNLITVDVLVKMLDDTFVIGDEKETLVEPYISRCLTQNVVDFAFLETCDKDILILLDCKSKFIELKRALNRCHFIDVDRYLSNTADLFEVDQDLFDTIIYKSEDQSCLAEFEELCKRNEHIKKCHHFAYLDGNLKWLRSKGGVDDLEKYKLEETYLVEESELWYGNETGNINVLVGDPGSGKSVILQSFKNNFPSTLWTVIFSPSDIEEMCSLQSQPNCSPIEKFLDKKYKGFITFFKIFFDTHQTAFFWDALDELSPESSRFATNLITELSEKCAIQWVTSRSQLKKHLEKEFGVLSRKMVQFNDAQQKFYVKASLKNFVSDENIDEIMNKIKATYMFVEHTGILGNPLKLALLTDLLRQDHDKYLDLLNKTFSLADLYYYFVQEKLNIFYKKAKMFPSNPLGRPMVNFYKKIYQMASLKALIPERVCKQLRPNYEEYLQEMEARDPVGIIIEVDSKTPRFIHSSFPEYFVAVYLAKHLNEVHKLGKMFFDRKFTNVRYFFDLLLVQKSSPHFAVLNKNVVLLKNYESDLASFKDQGGRRALHLMCSWMQRYPILVVEQNGDCAVIDDDFNFPVVPEKTKDLEMLEYILERVEPTAVLETDELFHMNVLFYARESESLMAMLQILLKLEVPVDDNALICNLLYYSARLGNEQALDLFKSTHGQIRTKKNGDSLLHLSVNHHPYVVKLLEIEPGMVKYVNNAGETPLFGAARIGDVQVIKELLKQGADVDVFSNNGERPLHLAARYGHLEVVLLFIANSNVNVETNDGQTPMYKAAKYGYSDVVTCLLTHKSEVNLTTYDGWTALNAACQNGQTSVVNILLEADADVNISAADGPSPLWNASYKGYTEIVESLLQKQARTDFTMNGWTSLHVACQNGYIDTATVLIQHHADVNAKTNFDWTPLHAATINRHKKIVELLISSGADLDFAAKDGRTAIYVAASNGDLDTITVLLEEGANVNSVTKSNQTALYIASYHGYERIVNILLEYGAKTDIATHDDWTPLKAARYFGYRSVVEALTRCDADK